MEYLNGYSDDFLSSGIYQMYCNEPDLRPEWSDYDSIGDGFTRISGSSAAVAQADIGAAPQIATESAAEFQPSPPHYYQIPQHHHQLQQQVPAAFDYNDFLASGAPATESTTDIPTTLDADDLQLLGGAIESFLLDLDNGADDWSIYADTTAPHHSHTLPERTFFCNDSCDAFLLESSVQLSMHGDSIQQYTEPISNDDADSEPATASSSDQQTSATEVPATVDSQQQEQQQQQPSPQSFACTFSDCTKVYAKPVHLKAHLRRHMGDKPYVCTWPGCTWKFSRSDELSRHRRSHSGVKPYQCVYCTKCFARSDHLNKHRKVHERKLARQRQAGGCSAGSAALLFAPVPPGRPGRRPKVAKMAVAVVA